MQSLSSDNDIGTKVENGRTYTLDVAAELIPMPSVGALYQFLFHNKAKFPPRYTRIRWWEVRLLTGGEILQIREMRQHSWAQSRYNKVNRNGNPRPLPIIPHKQTDAVAGLPDESIFDETTSVPKPRRQSHPSKKTVLGPIAQIIERARA